LFCNLKAIKNIQPVSGCGVRGSSFTPNKNWGSLIRQPTDPPLVELKCHQKGLSFIILPITLLND
jgi:hypothetical protein